MLVWLDCDMCDLKGDGSMAAVGLGGDGGSVTS